MINKPKKISSNDGKYLRAVIANIVSASVHYTAIACPFKYILVDPNQLIYHCPYSRKSKVEVGTKLLVWGKIVEGDWDLDRQEKLKTTLLADQLAMHFFEGVPWEELPVFEQKQKKISKNGKVDGCKNRQELIDRYHRLDLLWRDLKRDKTLKSAEERQAHFIDDLFVTIGRDGSYMFSSGGSHRLAMAQLCGIGEIPVRVVIRHSEWQLKRVNFIKSNKAKDTGYHQDFNDLLA